MRGRAVDASSESRGTDEPASELDAARRRHGSYARWRSASATSRESPRQGFVEQGTQKPKTPIVRAPCVPYEVHRDGRDRDGRPAQRQPPLVDDPGVSVGHGGQVVVLTDEGDGESKTWNHASDAAREPPRGERVVNGSAVRGAAGGDEDMARARESSGRPRARAQRMPLSQKAREGILVVPLRLEGFALAPRRRKVRSAHEDSPAFTQPAADIERD